MNKLPWTGIWEEAPWEFTWDIIKELTLNKPVLSDNIRVNQEFTQALQARVALLDRITQLLADEYRYGVSRRHCPPASIPIQERRLQILDLLTPGLFGFRFSSKAVSARSDYFKAGYCAGRAADTHGEPVELVWPIGSLGADAYLAGLEAALNDPMSLRKKLENAK